MRQQTRPWFRASATDQTRIASSYTTIPFSTPRTRERPQQAGAYGRINASIHDILAHRNMDQEQALQRPVEDGSTAAATAPSEHQHQLHPPPLEPSPDDIGGALHYAHRSNPPPAYSQLHDPASLSFPDAPDTELPPIQSQSDVAAGANHDLPSLSSVTGPQPQLYGSPQTTEPSYSPEPLKPPTQWPSMNPLTTFYAPSHAQATDSPQRMDVDVGSTGRASSVSLDDPDVRMAAEALGDLRAGMSSAFAFKQGVFR